MLVQGIAEVDEVSALCRVQLSDVGLGVRGVEECDQVFDHSPEEVGAVESGEWYIREPS